MNVSAKTDPRTRELLEAAHRALNALQAHIAENELEKLDMDDPQFCAFQAHILYYEEEDNCTHLQTTRVMTQTDAVHIANLVLTDQD